MDSTDGSACRVSAVQHRPGTVTKLVDRIKLFSVVLIFPSFVPSLFPIISLTTVAINTITLLSTYVISCNTNSCEIILVNAAHLFSGNFNVYGLIDTFVYYITFPAEIKNP